MCEQLEKQRVERGDLHKRGRGTRTNPPRWVHGCTIPSWRQLTCNSEAKQDVKACQQQIQTWECLLIPGILLQIEIRRILLFVLCFLLVAVPL